MVDKIEDIEEEINRYEAVIRLQKQKNELDLLKDGTFQHFVIGVFKILDNPILLILCIIMFFVGYWLRGM